MSLLRKGIALFIFLAAAITAGAQTLSTFSNKDFSIGYPATWRVDTSRSVFNAVIFYSPLEGADDKFSENVNVLSQDLRGKNIDMAGYKKLSEDQIVKFGMEGKIVKSDIIKDDKGEVYVLEYSMSMNGNHLHTRSVCRFKNSIAWLATFTAAADRFPEYDSVGSAMLKSFTVR